jgi:hypothetical protein
MANSDRIAKFKNDALANPSDFEKQKNAGYALLFNGGDTEQAILFLKKAAALNEAERPLLSFQIACAMYEISRLNKNLPADPVVVYQQGAHKFRRFQEIEKYLKQAFKGDVETRDAAHELLGRTYLFAAMPDKAIKHFLAIRRFEHSRHFSWELANAYYYNGRLTEAIEELNILDKLGESFTEAKLLLKKIYEELNDKGNEQQVRYELEQEAIQNQNLVEREQFLLRLGHIISGLPYDEYNVAQLLFGHVLIAVPSHQPAQTSPFYEPATDRFTFSPKKRTIDEVAKELGKDIDTVRSIWKQVLTRFESLGVDANKLQQFIQE